MSIPAKARSSKKKPLFYAIALCLPFLLLALAELGLRAAGYGHVEALFVESKQFEGYLETNPNIIQRFFYPAKSAPAIAPDTYIFKAQKPANTLRIVAMGGSTMAGFPYGRFASPSGMLRQRLAATHPNLKLEIISVAMSSINSFALLDFSEEVLAIDPDIILIYAGHNEYLGVMGVGSSFAGKGSYSANLLFLKLKGLRIYQLLQATYHSLVTPNARKAEQEKTNAQARTLMAQVARNKDIAYKSEIYEAGKTQFEANLALILAKFSQSQTPVFISSIAANEAGQPPFSSNQNLQLEQAIPDLATLGEQALQEAIEIAHTHYHADFMYALGRHYLTASEQAEDPSKYNTQAKEALVNARDYDLLRFRAPSEFNKIIEALANEYGAHYVDGLKQLAAESVHGIVGDSLMLEHLHPNLRGYFLLAEAYYQALIKQDLLPLSENTISREQAWRWQGLSKADQVYAQFKIAQLMSDYPFTGTPQSIRLSDIQVSGASTEDYKLAEARLAGAPYLQVQQEEIESLQKQGRRLEAALSAGKLFHSLPNQVRLARIASLLFLRENALAMAEYYAIQALRLAPREVNFKLTLAEILYKSGKKSASIDMLDEVIAQDPSNVRAKQIKQAISRPSGPRT